MNRQIKLGAIISYIGIFINIVLGLFYTPWLIHSIGIGDYGLYTLAMSVIGIFVFDFGLGQAITRFAAKYVAEGKQKEIDQLMGITYKLYIVADIIILLVLAGLYIFIPEIYQGLNPEELEKFKIVYALAATFSVLSFPFLPLNGIISAYELFIPLKICDLLHKLVTVSLMTGCLLLGYGLYALVVVNTFAGILMIIIKLIVLRRETTLSIDWNYWNRDLIRDVFNFSAWVTIAALAQRCVLNICPSILGYAADSQSIAIFGIAMTLEGYVFTFTNAINGLFLPKVTRLISERQQGDLLPLMIRVGRIQLFILGLIVLGFLCAGRGFVNVWVGPNFSAVFLCSLLMIAPSFIGQTQNIGATAIIVQNKVKKSAGISVAKAITNLILAYPFTLLWGVYGMALAVFLSYSLSLIQFNMLYHRDLHINMTIFFRDCFLKMAPALTLVVVIHYSINFIIDNKSWFHFALKAIFFIINYFVIMFLFGLNKSERSMIMAPVKKVFRI